MQHTPPLSLSCSVSTSLLPHAAVSLQTLKAYSVCKDSRYRPTVLQKGGQLKFPFLIDPNSNGPAAQG